MDEAGFFHTSYDVFGSSKPLLSLNQDSYLILPKTADFDELTSEISYDSTQENEAARINYYFHDTYVGTASVTFTDTEPATYDFSSSMQLEQNLLSSDKTSEKNIIFVNIKMVLLIVVIAAALLILLFVIRDIRVNYAFVSRRRSTRRRRYLSRKKRNRTKGPKFPF
jgi:hypothetical protein